MKHCMLPLCTLRQHVLQDYTWCCLAMGQQQRLLACLHVRPVAAASSVLAAAVAATCAPEQHRLEQKLAPLLWHLRG